MNAIQISTNLPYIYTPVPGWFIDRYLAGSNGDFVKVYLVLLKALYENQGDCTPVKMADQLQLTESDVLRAIKYWASQGLLDLVTEGDDILSLTLIDKGNAQTEPAAAETKVQKTAQVVHPAVLPPRPAYSMDDIDQFVNEAKYRDLIYVTERFLGNTMSPNDLSVLFGFHDWLGLPVEVIEFLVEYCVSGGHRNLRYMEKVAIEWTERGIDSLEKAKTHAQVFNKHYFTIKKALGFANRTPVPYEIQVMDKWLDDYCFDMIIILEACERTMKQAPAGSFKYADKILEEWHKNKVHSPADIQKLDEAHQAKASAKKEAAPKKSPNKFVNYDQQAYDFETLEKRAFERLLKENEEEGYKP